MHFTVLLSLATLSLAVPLLQERDLKVVTHTDWKIDTVTDYVTVWVDAGSATTSASLSFSSTMSGTTIAPSQATSLNPPPVPQATSPKSAPVQTSVTPAQSTTAITSPSASTSTSQATNTQSSGTYPVIELAGASASDGPCTPGQLCSGDITHYNPSMGVGACGYKDWTTESIWQDTDLVVAVSANIMGSFTNGGTADDVNILCKRSVHIKAQAGGQDVVARVVDKCPTCPGNFDLDLSPAVFNLVAPQGNGRVHNTEWFWV